MYLEARPVRAPNPTQPTPDHPQNDFYRWSLRLDFVTNHDAIVYFNGALPNDIADTLKGPAKKYSRAILVCVDEYTSSDTNILESLVQIMTELYAKVRYRIEQIPESDVRDELTRLSWDLENRVVCVGIKKSSDL